MNKFLLVLDSPAENEASVARLIELADASAEVQVLTIVHEPNLDGYLGNTEIYEPLRKRLVDEAADKATGIVERLKNRGINVVSRAVWDWPRGDAIRRAAFEIGADCIILSFGLDSDRRLGSRNWRFLAECPAPILVVNREADEPYQNIIAAVDPLHAHAKPAELDQIIGQVAAAVSEHTGAKLSLVHCYVPLARYGARAEDDDRVPLNDAEQALERSRQQAVDRLASEIGLDSAETRLIEGDPVDDLVRLVDEHKADLIVMGALSRGKLVDLIIGSTAEVLLRRAGCDILLVKPSSASS